MERRKPIPLCHIYAQYAHHGEAFIIGNRIALERLKEALDRALNEKEGEAELMVNDGEGYSVYVLLNNEEWSSDKWAKLAVPYTADYAKERSPDAIDPATLYLKE